MQPAEGSWWSNPTAIQKKPFRSHKFTWWEYGVCGTSGGHSGWSSVTTSVPWPRASFHPWPVTSQPCAMGPVGTTGECRLIRADTSWPHGVNTGGCLWVQLNGSFWSSSPDLLRRRKRKHRSMRGTKQPWIAVSVHAQPRQKLLWIPASKEQMWSIPPCIPEGNVEILRKRRTLG